MLKKIVIGLVALVALLVLFIATRPAESRVSRSLAMTAPPEIVFANVNDLHLWQAWSPWEKVDPNLKRTYDGKPEGEGAIYSWAGNDDVGEGRMTITESRPPELIRVKLEFFKPFAGEGTAEFTFQPDGKETLVTWTMQNQNGFLGKAMCLVIDMDKMIGDQFDNGLRDLKKVVEAERESLAAPDDPGTDDPGTDDPGRDDPGTDDSPPRDDDQ